MSLVILEMIRHFQNKMTFKFLLFTTLLYKVWSMEEQATLEQDRNADP